MKTPQSIMKQNKEIIYILIKLLLNQQLWIVIIMNNIADVLKYICYILTKYKCLIKMVSRLTKSILNLKQ